MRKLLLAALAAMPFLAQSQTISFETLTLPGTDTFYVNSLHNMVDDGFNVNIVHFPYLYDTSYGWSAGFAYTNKNDSVNGGYTNLYNAKAGKGHNGSDKYVTWTPGYGKTQNLYMPQNPNDTTSENHNWSLGGSMYVTNSTYAYNSMRDGDGLAKKFGGSTGNDPDWFKLSIQGYKHRGTQVTATGHVDFYLADFRSANNAQDYIIKDWTNVSLTAVGAFDSLDFVLSSSDTNSFGMLTPAFFCIDDIQLLVPIGIKTVPAQSLAKVYPNPVINTLFVDINDAAVTTVAVYDVTGKLIVSQPAGIGMLSFNTTTFANGVYMLRLEGPAGMASVRFVKQ